MTDNTKLLNSANPDPVDQFLGQILDEQQLIIDTPEARQQIIADMRALLMDQIDQAMVNELFVGADEVIVKKVTDAEGTEVMLSEGKFTQDGTYTVEVLVKADGLNENTFTLTYNVTI